MLDQSSQAGAQLDWVQRAATEARTPVPRHRRSWRLRPKRSGMLLGFVALLALGGCNKPKTETTEAYYGNRLPRPERVLVAPFAVTPEEVKLDQGVGARVQRQASNMSLTARQLQVARTAQSELTASMVQTLRGYGLPAEAISGPSYPRTGSTLLVQGQIISIDQGNRTRRTVIGLGAGKSSLSADMQLYAADGAEPPRFLTAIDGMDDSGRTPGLAVGMGAGAAAGRLATSAAVGGAMHVRQETNGATSDTQASKLGQALGAQVGKFAADQGWIPPSALR